MMQTNVALLGPLAQLLLASVLASTGLAKVLTIRQLRRTVEQLGIGTSVSGAVAIGVIAAELLAAVGLLLLPDRAWPRALVGLLALAFAVAGVRALATRQRIECNCFGGERGGLLGWRQILLLPCWLVLAAAAQRYQPSWSPRQGLLGMAVLVVGLACWRVPGALRLWRLLGDDRRAIDEGLHGPAVLPASGRSARP